MAFVVQPDGVRFGLGAIKGAGEGAIQSILETRRTRGGRVTSLFELSEHVDLRLVNKKVFECLVKAGALDSLAPGGRGEYLAWRARLLASLDRVLDHGNRHQRDRDQGQSQLFGSDEPTQDTRDDAALLTPARPWTETEALTFEKEALGLYMSGHPLQRYAGVIAGAGARTPSGLAQSMPDCAVAGVVTGLRSLKTKKGDRMCVFMLEDEASKVEVVVYPEAFARSGGLAADDAMLLVKGKFERDEESSKVVAAELVLLDLVRDKAVREVEILVSGVDVRRDALRRLDGVFERHAGDRPVLFVIDLNGGADHCRVRVGTARRIRPSEPFVRDVEAICGGQSVVLK
jgi:DNA polymerase-3 subunit alpha